VLGILGALSFSTLADFHPLGAIAMFEGKAFFDTYIHLVLNIMMPIGGILICVFAGWLVKRKFSREELAEGKDTALYKTWLTIVRFVAPAILALVLIDVATG
jgi:NSS family neurotransmitter:Na+ symporter